MVELGLTVCGGQPCKPVSGQQYRCAGRKPENLSRICAQLKPNQAANTAQIFHSAYTDCFLHAATASADDQQTEGSVLVFSAPGTSNHC